MHTTRSQRYSRHAEVEADTRGRPGGQQRRRGHGVDERRRHSAVQRPNPVLMLRGDSELTDDVTLQARDELEL